MKNGIKAVKESLYRFNGLSTLDIGNQGRGSDSKIKQLGSRGRNLKDINSLRETFPVVCDAIHIFKICI